MKKYIIIVSFLLIIYNTSCLKKDNSSTSSLAFPSGKSVQYYRLCGGDYLCKFSCSSNIKITTLTQQDLPLECNNPIAYDLVVDALKTYSPNIKTNILTPILKSNHLEIIPVTYQLLKDFDNDFSQEATVCDSKDSGSCQQCTSYCQESDDAAILDPWIVTQEGSNIIYQNLTEDTNISLLQWSKLIENTKQEVVPMNYEEAEEACKNYKFRNFSDWSLPSTNQLEGVSKLQLGKLLNNYNPKDQFVWSSSESDFTQTKVFSLRKKENEKNFKVVNKTDKNYTICIRTSTNN